MLQIGLKKLLLLEKLKILFRRYMLLAILEAKKLMKAKKRKDIKNL